MSAVRSLPAGRAIWAGHRFGTVPGERGQICDQAAFRYFVALERKRLERSRRSCLLLLVNMRKRPGLGRTFDPDLAGRVIAALLASLREGDVIGWFSERRVLGALLTPVGQTSTARIALRVQGDLMRGLVAALPADAVRRLRVRLHHLAPTAEEA